MPYKDPETRKQKQQEYSRKSYLRNKAKKNAASKAWAEDNCERMKELQHEWYEANKEKVRSKAQAWAEQNPERVKQMQKESRQRTGSHKKWKEENRHKVNAYASKRRAKLNKATPCWLSEDDLWLMEHIFQMAQIRTADTGVKHEVDHIVPLVNDQVTGFHVPWNLRIITAHQNRSKGNALCI